MYHACCSWLVLLEAEKELTLSQQREDTLELMPKSQNSQECNSEDSDVVYESSKMWRIVTLCTRAQRCDACVGIFTTTKSFQAHWFHGFLFIVTVDCFLAAFPFYSSVVMPIAHLFQSTWRSFTNWISFCVMGLGLNTRHTMTRHAVVLVSLAEHLVQHNKCSTTPASDIQHHSSFRYPAFVAISSIVLSMRCHLQSNTIVHCCLLTEVHLYTWSCITHSGQDLVSSDWLLRNAESASPKSSLASQASLQSQPGHHATPLTLP